MNDLANTNNSAFNLQQVDVGDVLKRKRLRLADSKLGVKDQFPDLPKEENDEERDTP